MDRAVSRNRILSTALAIAAFGCGRCDSPGRSPPPGSEPPTAVRKTVTMPPLDPTAERLQLATEFRNRFRTASVSFDRFTGFAKELSSFVSPPPAGVTSPEEAARAFVRENAALLGVAETRSDLDVLGVIDAPGQREGVTSRAVRFQQRIGKLPVYEGEIVVQLTAQNGVFGVRSLLKRITGVRGEPKIARDRALQIARDLLKGKDRSRAPKPERAEMVLYPLGNDGIRSWAVGVGSWLAIISAENGETLLLKNEARHGPDASVFTENVVKNNGNPTTRPITNLGTSTTLSGARFAVDNLCEAEVVSAPQEFRAPPSDANFDDQMAYYHLESMATVFDGLNVPGPAALPVLTCDEGLPCNAFYDPPNDRIVFGVAGSGCSGDCKKPGHYADIFYHELTHRVLDMQVGLHYDETESGAIHEGTSDFYSDSTLGNACMGEEWIGSDACTRNAALDRRYPRDMDTEPHKGGEVWASALWTLRGKLGKAAAERVVRQGMVGLPADADFRTYAGNVVTQGTAYYAGFFSDDGWKNFFLLLQIAAVMQGTKEAFCEHGIAVPYGTFVDLPIRTPDSDTRQSWSVSVPAGMKVDRDRGCLGGYDLLAPGGWQDLKLFEDNKGKLPEYRVDVTDTSLAVTMKTPGGCGSIDRVNLTYRLYTKAP